MRYKRDKIKVNSRLLKGARVYAGMTQWDMANALGVNQATYAAKELGKVPFYAIDILLISERLGLGFDQINAIFFENKLRYQSDNMVAPNGYSLTQNEV